MTIGPLPQCLTCARWRSQLDDPSVGERLLCAAFPDGIPAEIWSNQTDHRQPHEGDHGLQWLSRDGAEFPQWALEQVGAITKGHPHPGQRYTHGWVPIDELNQMSHAELYHHARVLRVSDAFSEKPRTRPELIQRIQSHTRQWQAGEYARDQHGLLQILDASRNSAGMIRAKDPKTSTGTWVHPADLVPVEPPQIHAWPKLPPPVIRKSLQDASTLKDVQRVGQLEARRITGQPVVFDYKFDLIPGNPPVAGERAYLGVLNLNTSAKRSVSLAREHTEGILRGLERFPRAPVSKVGLFHSSQYSNHEALAFAVDQGAHGNIYFNGVLALAGNNERLYREQLARSMESTFHPPNTDTPVAVALHEVGHTLSISMLGYQAHREAWRMFRKAQEDSFLPNDVIVSGYAGKNADELIAEAFADVMINGGNAHPVSRQVFDLLDRAYQQRSGGSQ